MDNLILGNIVDTSVMRSIASGI